jgi:hypothetical protein
MIRWSLEHEEEIVGVFVLVSGEVALHFDEADVVVVEARDDLRLPVLVEQAKPALADCERGLRREIAARVCDLLADNPAPMRARPI